MPVLASQSVAFHGSFFVVCEGEAALSGSFFTGACDDEEAPPVACADLGRPRFPFGSCVPSGSCGSKCF